jgi:hypothetical protein
MRQLTQTISRIGTKPQKHKTRKRYFNTSAFTHNRKYGCTLLQGCTKPYGCKTFSAPIRQCTDLQTTNAPKPPPTKEQQKARNTVRALNGVEIKTPRRQAGRQGDA